jgi:cob(I)alamin adenosyltransferase
MTRYFSGSGDDGYTGILGEGRIPKHHPIAEAVGTLDEATAALGIARAISDSETIPGVLLKIQRDLYHLMAEVSASPENAGHFRKIDDKSVEWLEEQTEKYSAEISLPKDFIVPGDSLSGAYMALARTIVRRAERRVAELFHEGILENKQALRYLNRLSSLCFVLELIENQASGVNRSTLAKQDNLI